MTDDGIDWKKRLPQKLAEDRFVWQEAIQEADTWPQKKTGDNSALIAMLLSDAQISRFARDHIADLLARHRLVRRGRGNPPTPAYATTTAEAVLKMGEKLVRFHQKKGQALDEALNLVSEELHEHPELEGLSIDALENFIKGRRGASRRRSAQKTR